MAVTNFFRQTITNLDANTSKVVTELNDTFKYNNGFKTCNFLQVLNEADNKIFVELNSSSLERFPVMPLNGSLIINIEDKIEYNSLKIVEENGNAVVGNIKILGAVL